MKRIRKGKLMLAILILVAIIAAIVILVVSLVKKKPETPEVPETPDNNGSSNNGTTEEQGTPSWCRMNCVQECLFRPCRLQSLQ